MDTPALRQPIALALLTAPAAAAHAHAPAAAAAPLWHWSFEPWVVVTLGLTLTLYLFGLYCLWRQAGRGRGVSGARMQAFLAGWCCTAVALMSPLDALGARSFAAHMLQHELLMLVAAPLLVLGRPLAVWAWALPWRWRRGAGALFRHAAWRTPWRTLTAPLSAWLLHAIALWSWHAPALFDAALRSPAVHAWQHASFVGTALLFWWSLLGQTTRAGQGAALFYLFTTMIHSGALGALLSVSPNVWYARYAGGTPVLGLDALQDQQLGGLLMWVPAGLVYLLVGLIIGARWLAPPRAASC